MKRVTRSSSRPKETPVQTESEKRKGETKTSSKSKKVEKIVEESEENAVSKVAGTSEVKTDKKTAGRKKVAEKVKPDNVTLESHVLETKKPSGVSASRKKAVVPKKQKSEDENELEEVEDEAPRKSKATSAAATKKTGAGNKRNVSSEDDDESDEDPAPKKSKVSAAAAAKKTGAGNRKDVSSEDDDESDEIEEEAPKTSKATAAAAATMKTGAGNKKDVSSEDDDESDEDHTPPLKKNDSRKTALTNKTNTNYDKIQFESNENFNFKIATWNVGGLRALAKKNKDYIQNENPDIICLNEIKCTVEEVPDEYNPEGYHAFWNIGKGSPGVGILSKTEPLSVTNDLPESEFSDEKRMITAEFEKFYLISVYVVNAGRGLKTLDKRLNFNDVFDEYVQKLDKKKPVIIAGDMNVSHQEIDLANPKTNKKNAGFTQQERDGFTKLLSYGFIDTFREFHPDKTGAYTFWSYLGGARTKNVGWRLDYFLVSQRLKKNVKDNVIRSEVLGSDHCPVVLLLSI